MKFKKHNKEVFELQRNLNNDIQFMALNVDNEEVYNAYKIYLGVIIKKHWALVKEMRFNLKPSECACLVDIMDYIELSY